MSLDRQKSIVRITSNNPEIGAYGTGFIVYQNGQSTYVLTCAHVVNRVGGIDNVMVDDMISAEMVALGSKGGIGGIDLAVLCIQGLLDRIPLNLRGYGKRGNRFVAPGYFSRKVSGEVEIVFKAVRGTLGENIGVGKDLPHLVNAWDLLMDNNYQLEPGYSGSPIIDEGSDCVIGVACRRVVHAQEAHHQR